MPRRPSSTVWWVDPVREVLSFERTTAEPGPDADAVEHRFVASAEVDRQTDAVLEIGGIATVWDVLVNGEVVRSGDVRHGIEILAIEADGVRYRRGGQVAFASLARPDLAVKTAVEEKNP